MNTLTRIFTLLFLLLPAACEEDKIDTDKFGALAGVVLNGDDYTPLQGVIITTSPASTSILTNVKGEFEVKKILEGEVAITARKKDFLSNSVSVSVYEDETTELTFYLLKDENNVGWVTLYDPVPGNGAVNQSLSTKFQWKVDQQDKSKELEYTVCYFESGSTIQNTAGENITSKEVMVDGLKYATTYYWYVVAKHQGQTVANSPTWSFKTQPET